MAEPDLAAALQLLVDHVPMPSDHRARIMAALTGTPYQSGPVIAPDPRDDEIAALKAQLAAAQGPTATVTTAPVNAQQAYLAVQSPDVAAQREELIQARISEFANDPAMRDR